MTFHCASTRLFIAIVHCTCKSSTLYCNVDLVYMYMGLHNEEAHDYLAPPLCLPPSFSISFPSSLSPSFLSLPLPPSLPFSPLPPYLSLQHVMSPQAAPTPGSAQVSYSMLSCMYVHMYMYVDLSGTNVVLLRHSNCVAKMGLECMALSCT